MPYSAPQVLGCNLVFAIVQRELGDAALGEPRVADLMAAGARLGDESAAALAFEKVHGRR